MKRVLKVVGITIASVVSLAFVAIVVVYAAICKDERY